MPDEKTDKKPAPVSLNISGGVNITITPAQEEPKQESVQPPRKQKLND